MTLGRWGVVMVRSRLLVVAVALSAPVLVAGLAVPAARAAVAAPPAAATVAPGAAAASNRGDVVFVRAGDLYLASHLDGTVRRLTWGGGRNDPAFSPDGKAIAYDRGGNIWLLVVGGSTRRLTADGRSGDQTWSADGRTIAYTRAVAGGSSDIFQIPTAGGTPVRLTWAAKSGCSASQPSWQPGTGWVAYVQSNSGGTCAAGIVRRKLGSAGKLTVPDPSASQPVYTADGEHLVYLAPCSGCLGIAGVWIATATGAGRHPTESLGGWTCGEGDMCVEAIAGSPFGGWAQEGTWSDPDTGAAMTCFQGAVEDPDGDVTPTAPSQCITGFADAFTVRPS